MVGAASGRNWRRLPVNVVCELKCEEEKWGSHTLQERVVKTDPQERVVKTAQTLRRAGTTLSMARGWTGRMRCQNEHGDTSDDVGLGEPWARAWILLSMWYEKPLDGLKLRKSKIHYMFKRWPWLLCGNGLAMKAIVGAGTWIRKLSQGLRQGMWPLGSVAAGRWSELTERILKTNPTTLTLSLDVGMGRGAEALRKTVEILTWKVAEGGVICWVGQRRLEEDLQFRGVFL